MRHKCDMTFYLSFEFIVRHTARRRIVDQLASGHPICWPNTYSSSSSSSAAAAAATTTTAAAAPFLAQSKCQWGDLVINGACQMGASLIWGDLTRLPRATPTCCGRELLPCQTCVGNQNFVGVKIYFLHSISALWWTSREPEKKLRASAVAYFG